MGVLSFEEFKKQREEEAAQEQAAAQAQQSGQTSTPAPAAQQTASGNYALYQESANNSGTLTFEQFQQARAAGTSYDDFLTQAGYPTRQEVLQRHQAQQEQADSARRSIIAYDENGRVSPWQTVLNMISDAKSYAEDRIAYRDATETPEERAARERYAMPQTAEEAQEAYGLDYEVEEMPFLSRLLGHPIYRPKRGTTLAQIHGLDEGASFSDIVDKTISDAQSDFQAVRDRIANPEPTGNPELDEWGADAAQNAEAARIIAQTYGLPTYALTGSLTQQTTDEYTENYENKTFVQKLGSNIGITAANYALDLTNAALAGWNALSGGRLEEGDGTVSSVFRIANFLQNAGSGLTGQAYSSMRETSNWLGTLVLDLEKTGVEQLLDRALGFGAGALIPMGIRVFGSGAQESENRGEDWKKQATTGFVRGGIEIGTEMLSGVGGSWRGTGYGDAFFNRIDKWVASKTGSELLGTLASAFGGEMVEEMLADILNPLGDRIFGIGEATGRGEDHTFMQKLGDFLIDVWGDGEILYDGLLGGLAGMGGGAVTHVGYTVNARNLAVDVATYKAAQRIAGDNSLRAKFTELTGVELAEDENTAIMQLAVYLSNVSESSEGNPGAQEIENNLFRGSTTGTETRSAQLAAVGARTGEVGDALGSMFQAAGIELNDSEKKVLASGYMTGDVEPQTYVDGVLAAYRLGQSGQFTLEEARRASEYAKKLTETQFNHAWQLGAMHTSTETRTADTSTEEGKNQLSSALAMLGEHAQTAAEAYESGQDVSTYAAAMNKAAALYVANGVDLKAAVQEARDGKSADIVGKLTDAQVEIAIQIGQQMQAKTQEAVRQVDEKFQTIRTKAAAIRARETASAQEIAEIDKAISEAKQTGKEALAQFNEELAALERMIKEDPDAENSEAYAEAYDKAKEHKDTALAMQDAIEKLQAKKKDLESKKKPRAGKHEGKATILKEGGKVGGMKYEAVDESTLSKTQKAVVRIAEAIARTTGLDIRIADFGKNVGGEYIPGEGGVLYLNISAQFDGKNLAIGSLTHELTHWLKEYAPKEYAELKRIVLSEMRKNPALYSDIYNQRAGTQPDLTVDELTDEMVANACQTIFMDGEAVQRIVDGHRTLGEKLRDFILKFIDDLKAAFSEIDTQGNFPLFREVRAAEGALDQMREAWLSAFDAAAENMQAEKTVQEDNAHVSEENARSEAENAQFQLIGKNEDGEEVYETAEQLKGLSYSEKLDLFKANFYLPGSPQYLGQRIRFQTKSGTYFAEIDRNTQRENVKKINPGRLNQTDKAKINVGAAGDFVTLLQNAQVDRENVPVKKKNNEAKKGVTHFDYFLKNVEIDGKRFEVVINIRKTQSGKYVYEVKLSPAKKSSRFGHQPSDRSTSAAEAGASHRSSSEDIVTEALNNSKPQFQMIGEVEATDKLVAVHNKSVSGLRRMLQRGGVPFPSIAIKKAGSSHEGFGDVSIVFPRSTIDPAASRWNRLYSNDAWTPTEPATEYDVGETWDLQKQFRRLLGEDIYRALQAGGYLESTQLQRDLLSSRGDVFEALKGRSFAKYAYLKSIGQEPQAGMTQTRLDGFGKYKNEQLLAVFDALPADVLLNLEHDSTEALQQIANVLNEKFISTLPENRTDLIEKLRSKPLYTADKVNPYAIRDAFMKYQEAGNTVPTDIDDLALDRSLRDNRDIENDPGYRAWIEQTFDGLIKDSGIPNGKGIYTDSGNRRSFKARHVPATLENIVREMRKEEERGNGFFGINLRGAATKTYSSVEEMRAESGKLLGERISDDVYDKYMREFYARLHGLSQRVSLRETIESWDSAEQILLEAIRDAKSKKQMDAILRENSKFIRYSEDIADDLWELRNDVQNMPAPYFEAKPRRAVSTDEALAYILPDNAASDVMQILDERGYNVLTYKAGDEQDRLAKLNSVEGAQFQTWEEGTVYNNRALLSEETLDKWLDAYAASNPNYAQAYIAYMSPNDFLRLTTTSAAGRAQIEADAKGLDAEEAARFTGKEQPIFLDIDTNTGKVEGHEGRHRMVAFRRQGIDEIPVLLFDFSNKYSKTALDSLALEGQDFYDRKNGYTATLTDVQPLSRGNKATVAQKFGEQTATEKLQERYNRYKNIQFQRWDDTTGDTATERNGRELAYATLQSENAILTETVEALRKLTDEQSNTIEKLQARLQLTKTPEARASDAKKFARQLLREYGSRADAESIAEQLKALGDYILQTPAAEIDEAELKGRARAIAAEIAESAYENVDMDSELVRQIAGEIKGKKLSIDEDFLGELDEAGGYDTFRKRNFGRFTLAKRGSHTLEQREGYMTVDQFYTDMQGEYGKSYFPDVANEGEQVQILAQMATAGAPMEVNPYGQYMGEVTEEMANRIVMDAMSGVLRQTAPTDADRAKSRRVELQEQIKALKRDNKLGEREAARLYQTVYDLSVALDRAESKYETLRQSSVYRTSQVRAEGAARAAEIKAAERERAARQISALKEHYREMRQNAKERREESANVSKYRKQVEKKTKTLYELLMTNSKQKHVPEVLKAPLAEYLEALDFSSKRLLRGGAETQNDMKLGARLQKLQQMLANQQKYINGEGDMQEDLGGYIDVSPDVLEYLRDMSERITAAMNTGETFTINSMSAADLKGLSKLLSNLTAAIRNMNYFMANARFESVREAASGDVDFMTSLGRVSERANGGVNRFTMWENGVPYYVFRRYGAGGRSIFEGFTKGWEKMAFNAQKIIDFTEKTYTDKEVRDWKNEQHEFTLSDGSKIRMTTAQIMELSQLLGREQAVKHISKGGVRIGNIETKKGRISDTTHYHLTMEDITNIVGTLTDRQLAVAKALQRFMAVRGAEWGNEISMRRFGYNFYDEGEGYYPIRTDSNDRAMADTDMQQNSMFRLLNLSSSKALNPKASNALIVGDIFDTFSDHMSDMAKLNGMGLPILDAIKWFNYKERVNLEDGQYNTRTLQGAMEQAYGGQAQHYFRTLMKDINGLTETGDRGMGIGGMFLSNYKAAAVGANLRVAMLQPTSYVRALTVLKPQYLAAAFTRKNGYQEAMKYSGSAVWKSLGYYDTDISKGMRGQIQHNDSFKDKVVEASMKLAELGDKVTWGRLWNACKMQAHAENKSLSGEALNEAAAELFREVIYSSQVMDATLTRSEIMRGKGVFSKMSSAFMAEPTLSYNILLDAASQYSIDERRFGKAEAWKRNAGNIGKAFVVYLNSAAFAAVVESLADAARDDDDDEYWDKFLEAFLGDGKKFSLTGNLAQDLTIVGKLPYLKDLLSIVQGYKSGNMAISAFVSALDAFNIWKETYQLSTGALDRATKVTSYGKMTEWGKIYKTLQAISQLSGVPGANLMRDAFAIWNTLMNGRKDEWKIKRYDSDALSQSKINIWKEQLQPLGITKAQYQKFLSEANTNGNSLSQDETGVWLTAALEAGEITREQADALWNAQGWKEDHDYSWWLSKNGGQTETEPAAPRTTTTAPAAPTVQSTAFAAQETEIETSPAQEEPATVSSYEEFRSSVPIYSDNVETAYELWQSRVQPLGIDLNQYVQIVNAANVDGQGTSTQDEMGMYLTSQMNSGNLSYEQCEAIWYTLWNKPRSKTFAKWLNR